MRHRVRFGAVEWMACALLFALGNGAAFAQSPETRAATGSISGIVTKDGKLAAGVGVLLVERSERGWGAGDTVARTRSDKEGGFTFEGLERGSYGLDAFLPGAFIHDSTPWDGPVQVTVGDGESVTGVKLELERGGVITGRLVDDEGRPVAGEAIHLYIEKPGEAGATTMTSIEGYRETDDRGIYRVFGLSPGRYAVGAGQRKDRESYSYGARVKYELAFHGGSATPEAAKIITVESGSEALNADIVVRKGSSGFSIAGKVVDAETRKPIGNMWLGRGPMRDGKMQGASGGSGVREDGSFTLEGVPPGSYGLIGYASEEAAGSYWCEPVEVTVTDRDVMDVVVEMKPGATLTGVIVALETDRSVDLSTVRNSQLMFQPVIEPSEVADAASYNMALVRIAADLTFSVKGLRTGAYRPSFSVYSAVKGFYVARVEVDGTPVTGPIRVAEIKEIGNVRIVVGRTTAVLRGRVVLRNGSVPFDRVSVELLAPGATNADVWLQLDSNGAFLLESAPPGEFVVVAATEVVDGKPVKSKPVTVTIGKEGTFETTIELDLQAKPDADGGVQ